MIDQDDIEFIHQNQQVAIKLDELPGRTFESTIAQIGPEMEYSSRQLSSKAGGDVMVKEDPTGLDARSALRSKRACPSTTSTAI